MKTPRTTVIIPVIGKDELILTCLLSIEKLSYPKEKLEVVLVDNGLDKDLKEKVAKRFSRTIFIGKGKNLGFAAAANLGLKKAKGEWVFVTNSDVLFDKSSLRKLVEVGTPDAKIGILGPIVYSLVKEKEISGQDMPGFGTDFFLGRPRSLSVEKLRKLKRPTQVDWVSGSGMMIRQNLIDKIGLLDERFFAYWEDADYGVRAKKAGFKVVLVPSAKIYHQGSVIMGKASPEKVYYLARNCLLFLEKHTSPSGKIIIHFRNFVLIIVKLIKAIFGSNREENLALVVGIFDFYQGKFGEREK